MVAKSHELPPAPSNESRVDELVRRVFDSNLGPETLTPKERLELLKESFGLPDHKRKLVIERLCAHYEIPTNDVKIVPAIELNAVLLLEYFGIDVSDVREEYNKINRDDIANMLGLNVFYPPDFAGFVRTCIEAAVRTHALATVKKQLDIIIEIQNMSFEELDAIRSGHHLSRLEMVRDILSELAITFGTLKQRLLSPFAFVDPKDFRLKDKADQIVMRFQTTQQLIAKTRITKDAVNRLKKGEFSLESSLEPITYQE